MLELEEMQSRHERDMMLLRSELDRKKVLLDVEVKEREYAIQEKKEAADIQKRQLAIMEKAMALASQSSKYYFTTIFFPSNQITHIVAV